MVAKGVQLNRELDAMEQEANAFAMELLMPEAWLRKDLAKHRKAGTDPEFMVEQLAKRYQMSVFAMTVRLTQLGLLK